jgi:hypothetical protein
VCNNFFITVSASGTGTKCFSIKLCIPATLNTRAINVCRSCRNPTIIDWKKNAIWLNS